MARRIIEGIAELKTLIGAEAGVTEWLTITQDRISQFADVTGDHQWIHIDATRAAVESPYKTTIAHGFLTLSLLSDFSHQAVDVRGEFSRRINYGLNRVRFPAPVPAGSRIRGRFGVHSVEDIEGGVQVIWNATIEVEGGAKPALAAEWITRLYY
ncbi:MAG: MaoC family dehydratase [Bryobacteraceae bacterium]